MNDTSHDLLLFYFVLFFIERVNDIFFSPLRSKVRQFFLPLSKYVTSLNPLVLFLVSHSSRSQKPLGKIEDQKEHLQKSIQGISNSSTGRLLKLFVAGVRNFYVPGGTLRL